MRYVLKYHTVWNEMDMKIRKRVSKEDKNKMRQKDPKQGEKYGEVKERGCKKRC